VKQGDERGAAAAAIDRDQRVTAVLLVAALLVAVTKRAFAMDDAYITFRTVDNVIHGHGLTWNPTERVQAYTNPLWMLVVSAAALVTREVYGTTLVLQLAATAAAAYLLATRVARGAVAGALAVASLLLSKAFVDYSTSGMENALGHLLLVVFALAYLRADALPRALVRCALAAALVVWNRLDHALLVAPALLVAARATWKSSGPRPTLRALAIGLAPLLSWTAFTLFYYGSAVPNSARAKLTSGVGALDLLARGGAYFSNSLRLDAPTLFVIFAALAASLATRARALLPLAAGIALTLLYVLRVGGDHMSGRFFSAPFVMAVSIVARLDALEAASVRRAFGGALAAAGWMASFSSLTWAYEDHEPEKDESEIADYARGWHGASGLVTRSWSHPGPSHDWIALGRSLRAKASSGEVPVLGGAGYAGYYAGPAVTILDEYALTEPLLARLPIPDAKHEGYWRVGHWQRAIPRGYRESLEKGKNEIENAALSAYYDRLRLVTRGPLFSPARLWATVALNVGAYDHYLNEYREEYDAKPVDARDLPPARPDNDRDQADCEHYSFWRPCVKTGVRFTSSGVLVRLGSDGRAGALEVELSPGDYHVAFWSKGKVVARTSLSSHGRAVVPVPEEVREAGLSAVSLRFEGDDKRDLTYFVASAGAPPPAEPPRTTHASLETKR
jgi:arabinofuranosyltransferase